MTKLLNVCGARPNFMKIAALVRAYEAFPGLESVLVHTGQHYDERMSTLFFRELELPQPDVNLEVGSASHAVQTAEIMRRFEPVLLEHQPDWVVVVGDVNSTIACSLVAAKLGVRVAHVEAGLRSFDREMPEEINRVLTDRISDLLFVTERSGVENLQREGVAPERIHLVGNVMIDTLLRHRERARRSNALVDLQLEAGDYVAVTLHRPSNVDEAGPLGSIVEALCAVSLDAAVVFAAHPRTHKRLRETGLLRHFEVGPRLRLVEPLGYLDFLHLTANARAVLTDSGGVQEETTILDVPCLTLRHNTERPVTLTHGTNRLVDPERDAILAAWEDVKAGRWRRGATPELWDGKAGERIARILAGAGGVKLRERLARLPPAISRIPLPDLWRAARESDPAEQLRQQLARRLGAKDVWLHTSGRDALRAALVEAARATGRNEVLAPAYTCFSVPAACVAAGLRVRLLDLDEHGRALVDQPSDRDWGSAAACIADNLFGLASALGALAGRARASGSWLIDDAAQALGARSPEGPVGSRGDVGVLSFGRGKPLSGLGGGALAWTSATGGSGPTLPAPAPLRAGMRWVAYALASRRPLFGLLASVPALGIGETVYDPDFARAGIGGAAALLVLAALSDLDASAARRRAVALEIALRLGDCGSEFEPLLEPPGSIGVYPRLALLAPDARRRDAALEQLRICGATTMYPTPLGAIPGLAPHLVGEARCPGAERFCARLLTLPTHADSGEAQLERMLSALA